MGLPGCYAVPKRNIREDGRNAAKYELPLAAGPRAKALAAWYARKKLLVCRKI